MGHVLRAYDPLLQRNVAIKMLVLDSKATADQIQRMQREAKALARMKHRNVVQILDFDITENGQPFLVMDLIEGPDLEKTLDDGPLPVADALEFGLQICNGLQHAHKNSVLHRDLKPGNVLIQTNDDGERIVKIIDLGLAKFQSGDQKLTHTGAAIGSPYYMSPEQAKGQDLDERSDIYSFGCLLFEMLTDRPPFKAANAIETLHQQISMPPPTLSAVTMTEFDEELENIVAKCLAKDPDERFGSVEELVKELGALHDEYCQQKDAPNSSISNRVVAPFKAVVARPAMLALFALSATVLVAWFFFVTNTKLSEKNDPASVAVRNAYSPNQEDPFDPLKKKAFEARLGLAGGAFEFRKKGSVWACKVGLANIQLKDRNLKTLANHKPRFEELDISDREVDGSGLRYLSNQPIKFLNMENTVLNDDGAKNIRIFKNLDRLDVACCDSLTNAGMQTIANNHPNLYHLEFGSQTTNLRTFEIVSSLPKLQYILIQLQKQPLPTGYGKPLEKLKHLIQVAFRNCNFLKAQDLRELNSVSSLKTVAFWGQRITANEMEALNTLPITELHIAETNQFEPGVLLKLKRRDKFKIKLLKVQLKEQEIEALKKKNPHWTIERDSGYLDPTAFEL